MASTFLSTPSARRATLHVGIQEVVEAISIHALREEGDHITIAVRVRDALFLSTPSARRATSFWRSCIRCEVISIHALREEGDAVMW